MARHHLGGRSIAEVIDDGADVAEDRYLDQRHEEANHHDGGKARPDLPEIMPIEGNEAVGWLTTRPLGVGVDKAFKKGKHDSTV